MSATRVIKFFIKNSPVGELADVLEDISNIIGQDFLKQPEIKQALREYYEAHKIQLSFTDGSQGLVTGLGRQEPLVRYVQGSIPVQSQAQKKAGLWDDENEEGESSQQLEYEEQFQEEQYQQEQIVEEFVYYDPVKKAKFSFHPITLEAKIEEESVDLEASSLPSNIVQLRQFFSNHYVFRNDVIEQMNLYVARQFRRGTTLFTVFADHSSIKVEVSCHNFNFKNYWGGEFLSSYNADVSNQQLDGSVKVHNHYFEQGNIQFNLNKNFPASKVKSFNGKGIVDQIAKLETDYQEGLEEMYTEVSEKLLKGMRRILPVTRTKFDWSRPNLI
ncbi:f-actin capping protein alpha subunit [Stylonychia lemnae]|uniref:F-actin-capping protein subunit alpha n=1 Tax=Stylonychia lemnae TaxID=5949 RepID=A0A078ABK2_STYLE|nr:f-actin capping protein alpha subunit [Stylonychia lemnae]|eukprot:CDW79564.1 f-actin capping protein alpha subunit [Stylonychia lemnae]